MCSTMKLLHGHCRKIAVAVLPLSAAGWIAFVVSFCWLSTTTFEEADPLFTSFGVWDNEQREHERWFSFWAFAVCGPVLYVLAFIHLLIGQWYIGFFSNFCAAFFLVVGGGILHSHGNLIVMVNEQSAITDTLPGRLVAAEFAGCLAAVSSIALYVMIQPFFTDVNRYGCLRHRPKPSTTTLPVSPIVGLYNKAYSAH